jgi:hypothetical protein
MLTVIDSTILLNEYTVSYDLLHHEKNPFKTYK